MNNSELIDAVASSTGSTKADAKKNVDAVVAAISNALVSGNEVSLNGFGKFKLKDSPAREGRNPATGETIQIAASKNVKFAASKTLKDLL